MENQILKEIERLQKSAREYNPKSDYRDGYLKALLNIKQEIKEMIDMNLDESLNNIEIEYLIDLIETDREISEAKGMDFSKHKKVVVGKLVEKLTKPDVMVSDLVKVENAYIEDAEFVGSYDVTGRVEQLWITKEDFNKIKCISN